MVNKTIIYIGVVMFILFACYNFKTSSLEHYHNIVKKKGYNIVISNKEIFSKQNKNNHRIVLIQQFHIPTCNNRYYEIKDTLQRNINNPYIKKIYLLNERKYSNIELGSSSTKIKQVIVNNRLTYSSFFKFIKMHSIASRLPTYYILSNNDIFFDNTVQNIRKGTIHQKPSLYALLRYEFVHTNLKKCPIYGPTIDSQDTWIFHSNNIKYVNYDNMNISLGIPTCDNSIAYRLYKQNFTIYNEPSMIRTYHNHKSTFRAYNINRKDKIIPGPYCFLEYNL